MGSGRQVARGACWLLAAVLGGVPLLQPALAEARPAELVVTGEVSGLRPGVPSTLVLTVSNPGERPAQVAGVDVTVTSGSGRCPATALRVSGWQGRTVVPAHGSVQQPVPVLLDADCGDARFALHYEVRGA